MDHRAIDVGVYDASMGPEAGVKLAKGLSWITGDISTVIIDCQGVNFNLRSIKSSKEHKI